MNIQDFWSLLEKDCNKSEIPSNEDIESYNDMARQQEIERIIVKLKSDILFKIGQIAAKLQNTIKSYPENSQLEEMYFNEISSIEGFISLQDEIHEILTHINPKDRQVEGILNKLETIQIQAQANLEYKDITLEDLQIPVQSPQPLEPVIIKAKEVPAITRDENINDSTANKVEVMTLGTREKVNQLSLISKLNTKINKYMLSSGALLLLAFILNAAQKPQTSISQTSTNNASEVQTEIKQSPVILSESAQAWIDVQKELRLEAKSQKMYKELAIHRLQDIQKVILENRKLLERTEHIYSLDGKMESFYKNPENSDQSFDKYLSYMLISDYIMYKINARFGEDSLKLAKIRLKSINPYDTEKHILDNHYRGDGDIEVYAEVLGFMHEGKYHPVDIKLKKLTQHN